MRRMMRVLGLVISLFALLAIIVPVVSAAGAERETITFDDVTEVIELTPEEAACLPGVDAVAITYDGTVTILTTPVGVIHVTFNSRGTFEAMDGSIRGTFQNHFAGKGTSLEEEPQVSTFVAHLKAVGPNGETIMLNQHAHLVRDKETGEIKVDFYKVNCVK